MSTKFEQLLDYLVNEEMDKANELFHEIVVEKSREIYENLISEELDEESEVEEQAEVTDESDENLDETMGSDDSMEYEEGVDDDDDDEDEDEESSMPPQDNGDDLLKDIETDDEEPTDQAKQDILTAIAELEAAIASLDKVGSDNTDMDMELDAKPSMDDEESAMKTPEDFDQMEETMGLAMENKRMTREYVEKVGNDWEKSGSMKSQGQHAGAGTGDKDGAPHEGKSAVASGANKPGPAGVNGKNLVQGATEGQKNTGTTPNKVQKGITPDSSEKFDAGQGNVPGGKMGVGNLKKVGAGYPGNNAKPGPVGSGTGDKAGQTSVGHTPQMLKPYSK